MALLGMDGARRSALAQLPAALNLGALLWLAAPQGLLLLVLLALALAVAGWASLIGRGGGFSASFEAGGSRWLIGVKPYSGPIELPHRPAASDHPIVAQRRSSSAMSPARRRMTVIVSLDVVGYTKMLRADERGTLRAMSWIRRELGEPALARHHGSVIKVLGDGAIIEFDSVHEAAVWAMEFQRAVRLADKRNNVGQPVVSRISIALADLIIAGEERYGEGLNFGVRLQEVAPPGGVCVSEAVWFNLRSDMRERYLDAGYFHVKNIDEPVRGYFWTIENDPPPAGPVEGAPAIPGVAGVKAK